ncbi:MAG: hypothetical protein L6Q97_17780 [Thermoanaerobaculia bacterium]|nr:hypothetical protein [Thermoanaerobaculia bacterium]
MAKHRLRLFSAVLVFSAWLFSVASADAQVATNVAYNWKSGTEAMNDLEISLVQLEADLNAQTPGSPAYLNTEARIDYYKMIHFFIEEGKSVEEAIKLALGYVDTTWLGLDYSPTVLNTRAQWYNGALQVLTN